MKSVSEAREIILGSAAVQSTERLPLLQAYHRVLAEDVVADQDIPAFDNTSMDGYAVLSTDTATANESSAVTLKLVGEVSAGKVYGSELKSGEIGRAQV